MGFLGNKKQANVDMQEVPVIPDETSLRIDKLNAMADSEKQYIDQLYCKIGKQYVQTYQHYDPEAFSSLLEEVHQAQSKIEWLNGYIDDLQGILRCPNPQCRHTLSSDSKFCNYCGTKLNIAEYVPCPRCGAPVNSQEERCIFCNSLVAGEPAREDWEANDTIQAEKPRERICRKCGRVLTDAEIYCINCGTKYE